MSNFYDYLNAVKMRQLPEAATHDIEGTDAKLIAMGYTMAINKGKKEEISISDPEIIKSIEALKNLNYAKDAIRYIECREYARLWSKEKILQNMGFENLADFGYHMFGKKKETVNQLTRIGRFLLTEDSDGNVHPISALPQNIAVSAMIEMLAYCFNDEKDALDLDKIVSWYNNGILADGMSTKKMRAALKLAEKGDDGKKDKEGKKDDGKKDDGKKDDGKKDDGGDGDNNNDAETFINQLDSMEPAIAANTAIQALKVVQSIVDKFITDENVNGQMQEQLEHMMDYMRGMVK